MGDQEADPEQTSLGIGRGGAVRLCPLAEAMVIAASIEDALAFLQMTGRPTWAVPGGLQHFEPPEGLREITIVAEAHVAGRVKERLLRQGLKVAVASPRDKQSFVDLLVEFEERQAIGEAG